MSAGPVRGNEQAGRSTGGLVASLLAVIVLFAALLPFLLSKNPAAEPPAEVAAAARLAQSLAAELQALPVTSPLLLPPPGESSFTFTDPLRPAANAGPGGERLSREWHVEGLRFDPASSRWLPAASGTPRDAVRITVRIRKREAASAREVLTGSETEEPVLARVVLYRALVEGRP